jgi:phosphohistidine swiveling domain-containing protein
LVRDIASSVNGIQKAYAERTRFVDTEFAIDQNGNLYFLQSRPATLDLKVVTVEEAAANSARKILEGGTKATRKAAHGTINIIPSFQALKDGEVSVEPNDVVVTYHTWNEWTEYLRGMQGIVTTQGGTLSHAAIISREWGVAGIVGCEDAVERLKEYEGKAVTIDANRRSVYLGGLPLEERIADPKEESIEVQQTEEKRIKPVEHLMQDEEGEWLGRPNYQLGRLQLEIYWNAFDRLDEWLVLRPTRKKIKEGVIYTLFGQEDLGRKLDSLSVDELGQIYRRWVETERDFVQASETFELNEQSYRRFIDLYTWMNTFMDMAFTFNTHLERRLRKAAQEKRMPQTFYDEALTFLEGIVEHEDTKREREAVELGKGILPHYQKGKDAMQMFREIGQQDHGLSDRIVAYSKSYRFGRSDFRSDSPIERVMRRLVDTIEMGLNPPQEYAEPKDVGYFPEDPEFQKLLELAVKCKIQANNFHHTKARGQWMFRDAMLDLGNKLTEKGVLSEPLSIFELSIDEVSRLVRSH